MKSLCTLLRCVKTRTAPYHPEFDGMVECFNRTCLMLLSMFVNDWRDTWNELLPFVMHAYVADIQEGDSKEQLWITVKSFIQLQRLLPLPHH